MNARACPICRGPIAIWAIRPELTCHHCGWALAANVGSAFVKACIAGAIFFGIAFAAMQLALGELAQAIVSFEAASYVGLLAGMVAYPLRIYP